ncbi:MAG: 23S rRNA (uracil(1939)-C(5))-methyltransferase RlmD [Bacteroidales bacterium]
MESKNHFLLYEKVTVTDMGTGGNAVAKAGKVVIFLPMAVPGDIVDIKIIRRKRNYYEGIPVRFHKYSPGRDNPVCQYFGICGGCTWQFLKYDKQLFYKEKSVRDALGRIGKIEAGDFFPILASPEQYYYRNKLEYTFSSRKWLTDEEISVGELVKKNNALGFHKPGHYDRVIDIHECHLQPEPTNLIRNAVRDYASTFKLPYYNLKEHTGFLRNLIIRNTLSGQVMVIVVFHEDDRRKITGMFDFIRKEFPGIASLMYVINRKKNDTITDQEVILHSGKEYLTEEMNGLKFRIGPKSFYQTNTRQAVRLYEIVRKMAGLTGNENVYDLYSGTGTIACFLASGARAVTGLEYVMEAVDDAEKNARINNLNNVEFIQGDIRQLLSEGLFERRGKPDVIVTDPPRSGMHKDVVRSVIASLPERIIYVSCNPATQARDIQLLAEKYSVKCVQPVDMFPQTPHVENVALLCRK